MTRTIFALILSSCVIKIAYCQCRTEFLPSKDSFDIEKYKGGWQLQAYSPSIIELVVEPEFRCNVQTFFPTDDPSVFNISNEFIRSNGSTWRGENQVKVEDLTKPAVWTVSANGLTFQVSILGTDYTSWSLMYGCGIFNGFSVEFAMIHTRDKSIDPALKSFLDSLVVELGFPQEFQIQISQTDCHLSPDGIKKSS